ncbi:MAG TPA: STAS domain-containing protein [Anaerolineae bacterium]|jgi:anti-sigma B factor antagonist|nr:STAS domain-containing protein [Anaerolineae bacterium]
MASKKPRPKANSTETNIAFTFERNEDTLVVRLAGEADLLGSSALRQALVRKLDGVSNIIFDLGGLEFADSYFLRLLIKLRKRLGGVSSVKVQNVKPNVRRIFEITGLDKLFM